MEKNNEQTVLPYHPSHEIHLHRVQDESFQIDPNASYLPDEFPKSIESPLDWKGKEVASKPDQWIFQLGEEDVTEIKGALERFLGEQYINPSSVSSKLTYPLQLWVFRLRKSPPRLSR